MLDLAARNSNRPILIEATDRFDFGSDEYRRLFPNASASAFQHPDWLKAFYRNVAPAHDAEPLVVTGRDVGGELQLLVPLVRRKSGDAAGSKAGSEGGVDLHRSHESTIRPRPAKSFRGRRTER